MADEVTNVVRVSADNVVSITTGRGEPQRVGKLIQMEDGYMQFFPDLDRGGCWPVWMLRAIADQVDRENAEWDKQIATYFEYHKEIER